jgi:hypothetical protein
VDGLALHPVQSVAANPQQVSLFLAQPEHLEQGQRRLKVLLKRKYIKQYMVYIKKGDKNVEDNVDPSNI